jgi:branched-chain amino acid transport system permease protein
MSIFIQNLLVIQFGARQRVVPFPRWVTDNVSILGLEIQILQIASTVVTALALIALVTFLKKSSLGIAMRAAADDFEVTRLVGIRGNAVIATAFAVSGFLAGLASVLWVARRGTVDPTMGLAPLLEAFIAAVIGGLGSLTGAVVGGFVLGFIRVALESFLPSEPLRFIDAFTISLVVIVLLLRPQGLFGGEQVQRA